MSRDGARRFQLSFVQNDLEALDLPHENSNDSLGLWGHKDLASKVLLRKYYVNEI